MGQVSNSEQHQVAGGTDENGGGGENRIKKPNRFYFIPENKLPKSNIVNYRSLIYRFTLTVGGRVCFADR